MTPPIPHSIVLVSSSNAELLETLEYDVTTAGAVLVSDPTTDVIAAIPLNRVFRLTRDGACVDFSYLAHITFVHLGKMQIINVAAKASTSNPLQKAMGDGMGEGCVWGGFGGWVPYFGGTCLMCVIKRERMLIYIHTCTHMSAYILYTYTHTCTKTCISQHQQHQQHSTYTDTHTPYAPPPHTPSSIQQNTYTVPCCSLARPKKHVPPYTTCTWRHNDSHRGFCGCPYDSHFLHE